MIPFPQKKYACILADPPWHFKMYSKKGYTTKSAEGQYDTMTLEDIKDLPVGEIADKNCFLFLWATFPMIREAIEVMGAWGFEYKTGGAWAKMTKNGKHAFGTGYVLRSAAELFLIGTKGRVQILNRSTRNIIADTVREHSRKPDSQYKIIEDLVAGPRIELFARQHRDGWDCWGNQTDKFTSEPETERNCEIMAEPDLFSILEGITA